MANFLSNLYQKITTPSEKSIDKLIYGSMPKEDLSVPIKERLAGVRSNLSNYLLGAPAVTGQDDNSMPIYSSQERTGGAIRDFMNGFRENATNGFSPENWGQGKKNVATRIGEGLGSMARFMESPAGRALLVGGAVGLTGGNGLQALTFGTMTGAKNQSNRMADKLYRDDLIQTQQNTLRNNPAFNALSDNEKAQILSNLESTNQDYKKLSPEAQVALLENAQNEFLASRQKEQLQDIADNINSRRGYITQDVYKNLVDSQQLRDNADWKKLYFDTNQNNLEAQRDWQRQQFQMQQEEKRADRALQYAELGERRRKNNMDYQLGNAKLLADAQEGGENFTDVEAQLNNFKDSFKKVNNPYRYRIAGGASEFLNTLTPDEANFNSQRTLLFNQIARKLGGEKGVLSDQDIKRIDAALPKLSDTQAQKEAKMNAVYALLDIKKGSGNVDRLGIL